MSQKMNSSVNSLATRLVTYILRQRLGCLDAKSIIRSSPDYGMRTSILRPNDMPLSAWASELLPKLPGPDSWTKWSSREPVTQTIQGGRNENVIVLSSRGLEFTPVFGDSLIVLSQKCGVRGKSETVGVVSVYCMVYGPQLTESERSAYAKRLRIKYKLELKD